MAQADTLERQMLDLINNERASRGLNPVQLELRLNDSAEVHSEWMLQSNIFSHTGAGGSSAGDRMEQAGFVFSGSWTWAENIAWQSERGAPGLADDVINLHNSLMNSPGHRANILNPNLEVIGIGIERGNFNGWDAVMVTQNFAKTSAPLQIDNGGSSTPPSNTTGTGADDTLILTSAGTLKGWGGDDQMTGSSGNDTFGGGGGNDTIDGNGGHDDIGGGRGDDVARGGSGDDSFWMGGQNDVAWGGTGNDIIRGQAGSDQLWGEAGADKIYGGNANDRLFGGADNDLLGGGGGNDYIDGGSGNDTMIGGTGSDDFVFSGGDDRIADFDEFDAAERIIMSNASGITGYLDLRANHMKQVGAHVLIEDDAGNSLLVKNALMADLDSSDFLF